MNTFRILAITTALIASNALVLPSYAQEIPNLTPLRDGQVTPKDERDTGIKTTTDSASGTQIRQTSENPARSQPDSATAAFIQSVSEANLYEIEAGNLALQRSKNSDVRAFARQAVNDHKNIQDQLRGILTSIQSTSRISSELSDANRKKIDDLRNIPSESFDRVFVQNEQQTQSQILSLFGSYSGNGQNDPLKGFVDQTLPILQRNTDTLSRISIPEH